MIIAVLTCATLFAIIVAQVIKVQQTKVTRDKEILVVTQEGTDKHKAPMYVTPPDSDMYITIDDIDYDWEYFTSSIKVNDENGTNITDKVSIMVYKLIPDSVADDININNYVYIGKLTKDNTESLYSLDNFNVDKENNIIISDTVPSEEKILLWGYKTFINSSVNSIFSGKYKLVYQAVDGNGYKTEHNCICQMTSKGTYESTNISISVPTYQSVFNNIDSLANEFQNIKDNTTAIIADSDGQLLRTCIVDITTVAVVSDTPDTLTEIPINSKEQLSGLNNNALVRMSLTAIDTVSGQSINKVIDLSFIR